MRNKPIANVLRSFYPQHYVSRAKLTCQGRPRNKTSPVFRAAAPTTKTSTVINSNQVRTNSSLRLHVFDRILRNKTIANFFFFLIHTVPPTALCRSCEKLPRPVALFELILSVASCQYHASSPVGEVSRAGDSVGPGLQSLGHIYSR